MKRSDRGCWRKARGPPRSTPSGASTRRCSASWHGQPAETADRAASAQHRRYAWPGARLVEHEMRAAVVEPVALDPAIDRVAQELGDRQGMVECTVIRRRLEQVH